MRLKLIDIEVEYERAVDIEHELDTNEFGADDWVPVHLGKQVEAIEMRADCQYAEEPRRKPVVESWRKATPELRAITAAQDKDWALVPDLVPSWAIGDD